MDKNIKHILQFPYNFIIKQKLIVLKVRFDDSVAQVHKPNVKYNFIQHCFCDLGSHFEALESVLLIFFLGFASKKYDQTDSRAPKCLPRVTKTVMYMVSEVAGGNTIAF
jgi:hypothetical protein